MTAHSEQLKSPTPRAELATRIVRWGVPLLFVIFGVIMLIMSHGHLSGVQDSASESNPFVGPTSTDRDSVLSTIGIGSFVVALMIVLIGWMMRLSGRDPEREQEESDRQYFREHGHWPADS